VQLSFFLFFSVFISRTTSFGQDAPKSGPRNVPGSGNTSSRKINRNWPILLRQFFTVSHRQQKMENFESEKEKDEDETKKKTREN
jgi:hypothetical protein